MYRVFCQAPALDRGALAAAARRYGAMDLALSSLPPAAGYSERLDALLAARDQRGSFRLCVRSRTDADLLDARRAEELSRAAGMAALAERCPTVLEVAVLASTGEPETTTAPNEPAHEELLLELCALLAFVALGPILPPDGSALFGVRGARERAERLRAASELITR